ncbi:MAG: right-handed parallel beta-helix repeat-containing protein, partial [Bacteroidota bacterium]
IGGVDPDFLNFSSARNALLTGGIAGTVTFNVRNGTYNEQVSFPEILGANEDQVITFQSENGDSSLVTISWSATSNNNYTLRLDGADWLVFKGLTIEATNTSFGNALVLQNNANHNRIENCELIGFNTTSTSTNMAVVFSPDNNQSDEYNLFYQNLIRQGSYGFYWRGNNSVQLEAGNVIDQCRIENTYYRALFAQYQDAIKISNNDIITNSSYSDTRGIELSFTDRQTEVTKNRLRNFHRGMLIFDSDGTPTNHIKISNNFIQTIGTNQLFSLHSSSGSYQDYFHNTVRQMNTNPASSSFYVAGGSNKIAYSNIFSNEGDGYSIYRTSQSDLTQSDHNNLFTTGNNIAFLQNTPITTLTDWQNMTSFGQNSIAANPYFINSDSYEVAQIALNGTASTFGNITEDIEGMPRNSPADIGCDEFDPALVDAGVSAVLAPPSPFPAGNQAISIELTNHGQTDLTNATINWAVNGVAQTPVDWTGTLGSGLMETVSLGTVDFTVNQAYDISAWSSQPNGTVDPQMLNDSATVNGIYVALLGNYTIGGLAPDFDNFTEAVVNLNEGGILGVTAFDVRNGTYSEQVVLGAIQNASEDNTITFRSESGDSSTVVLSHSANSSTNYTLLLNGADWIRFEKMTLQSTNNTWGTIVELRSGATQNQFSNCVFQGINTTSTGSNLTLVVAFGGGQTIDNNVFVNNVLRNGSIGFYLYGTSTAVNNRASGLVIENNKIENFYYRGIQTRYVEDLSIQSNIIRTNSSFTSSQGIYLDDGFDHITIATNQVTGIMGRGIFIVDSNASANGPMLIANNYVQIEGTSTAYGIYTDDGSHQRFYHNSVQTLNTNVSSAAFFTFRGNNKDVRNNIFSNAGGGYAYFRSSSNGILISDYNNLYTSGNNIGFWDANQMSLTDWQTVSGFDNNSIAENPFFIEVDSFAVGQISLNNAGIAIAEVTTDIEGEIRATPNPDIGCDEFTPMGNNAGIASVQPPATPFVDGQHMVRAVLKNFGGDTLNVVILNWTINGTLQAPIPWTGSLASGDTLQVDLDLVDFQINQGYDFVVWTSFPNGSPDGLSINDTSSIDDIYAGLGGIYTIGGTSPDFDDFTQAATNLNFGGVVDSVTFNVRNGTYNEQIRLTETPGIDSNKTVTFQSESGDSSMVVLSHNSGFASNFVCQLDGADWIRFKALTLEATNATYSVVLDYRNRANNNRFENCDMIGISNTNSAQLSSVIYSPDNGVLDENNAFVNNYIRNGSYGIYIEGDNTSNRENGLILESNKIENSYYWAVYMVYQDGPRIHNNEIITNSSYATSYGLYLNACYNGVEITKNKIFGFRSRGIFLNNSNATSTEPMLIANNFVQLEGTANGRAIYTDDGQHQKFYYNTVDVTNTNTSTAAFYTFRGNNKEVLNNIFVNRGGGYAIFRSSTNGLILCDHNDLYVTGTNLGFWDAARADLASWQTASNLDANSISVDPLFVGELDLHVTNVAIDKKGTPIAAVNDDIDGDLRNPTAPDIGADEFITAQNDAGLVSIDQPSMPFAADIQAVYVSLLNNGLDTLTSVEINWEVNGVVQPTFQWTDTLLSAQIIDSVCIGTFPFEIDTAYTIVGWTNAPNGSLDEDILNDTASVENLYAALGGIYTIGGTDPDFPNFTAAVEAMKRGGVIDEVSFNVRNGTYLEQIVIPEINGASSTNTITFQSEMGDSTEVTLSYNTATSSTNYTLRLDGADWLTFRQMTLQNTSPSFTRVIDIRNGASNNEFVSNEIIGRDINSTSTNYALIYSNTSVDHSNAFLYNRFIDGSYGMYYLGISASTRELGTLVEGNTFENQYFGGLHLYYQTRRPSLLLPEFRVEVGHDD